MITLPNGEDDQLNWRSCLEKWRWLMRCHQQLRMLPWYFCSVYDTFDHSSLLYKDRLPCSDLLTLLSSGFSPVYLPAISPLRHRKPHRNHALHPDSCAWCSARFYSLVHVVRPLHYTTLCSLIKSSSVLHHLFAQLFITFSPISLSHSIWKESHVRSLVDCSNNCTTLCDFFVLVHG